jgi:hypothetical protein
MVCHKKYAPNGNGANRQKATGMNVPLAAELEIETHPPGMIAAKNRLYESYINKAKLKNLNAIICINGLGLTTQKSMRFFKGEHKYVDFLLHAVTLLGYEIDVSIKPSDLPFGKIKVFG